VPTKCIRMPKATKKSIKKELEVPDVVIKDKKGRSTSCYLCQRRKQKCDHRLPACTACLKAKVKCIQPAKYGGKCPEKDEYTVWLEKRLQFLESVVDANDSIKRTVIPTGPWTQSSSLVPINGSNNAENGVSNGIAAGITAASVGNTTSEFQLPLPTTSAMSALSSKVDRNHLKILNLDSFENQSEADFIKRYNLQEFLKHDPVFQIDEHISRQLFDIFFTLLQYKFPILDETEVFEFHNAYFSNNLKGYMNNISYFYFCLARMFLVCAISALLHKTTGRYHGTRPASFFSAALKYAAKCQKSISKLHRVELLILLVFYLIRTDKDSTGLFDVIRDAMSVCMELKLHKKESYVGIPINVKDRQLRCFWSAYLLEKVITLSLSKPYVLNESEMDSDIPMFDDSLSKGNNFLNQFIKIRRLEARFVEQLDIINTKSSPKSTQLAKVEQYFQELQQWRRECQGFSKGIENETLQSYYYRSVRTLIQPFLELLDPEDRLFQECQAAAAQICQSFKTYHQKTVSGHSTIHVHTTFIAGVTLIYCLWLARNTDDMRRKLLGDDSKHTRPTISAALFQHMDDLRACSISLYVMAERTKFALSFRDTFEEIMAATIGNLKIRCGPDSSEIIYNKEPGMPPAVVRKPPKHYTSTTELDIKATDAEELEEKARKEKRGQLQRNAIPKGLSHLLVDPVPMKSQNSSGKSSNSLLNNNIDNNHAGTNGSSTFLAGSSSNNGNTNVVVDNSINGSSFLSLPQTEFTPFVGRTNTMISNISVWTGESGQFVPNSMNQSLTQQGLSNDFTKTSSFTHNTTNNNGTTNSNVDFLQSWGNVRMDELFNVNEFVP